MFRFTELPCLIYHHVGPPRPDTHWPLTVEPSRFRRQIEWLKRHGYRSLTTADVVGWVSDGRPLRPRGVLLTFDDGYRDLAEWAFPVLEEAGYSGLVFVVAGLLGQNNAWDAPAGHGGHRLLTADEIRSWQARGIEFGGHTRTHPRLDQIPFDQAEREIVGGKDDLEDLIQQPVRTFAYPYGMAGESGRRIAAANFSAAFNDTDGRNAAGCDPFWINRSMVHPQDSVLDMRLRIRFGRSVKERARARLSQAKTAIRGRRDARSPRTSGSG
jgi:peptidoglycan/xylan/chitin deacetylase (PgdA/CDA1 family)